MPDIEHYQGREQGYIKHVLISTYLQNLTYKVFSGWQNVVYIDAFAGPWGSQDENFEDSSFGISIPILKEGRSIDHVTNKHQVKLNAYLVEKEEKPFVHLSGYASAQEDKHCNITCYNSEFEQAVDDIEESISKIDNPFVFALIDPKGWTGLAMNKLQKIFSNRRSEVVVNVMTSFLTRFVEVENCKNGYEQLFGRAEVRDILRRTPKADRMDIAVREYCRSLRDICGFTYVSSCIVLDQSKKSVKYFLVYATDSPDGIKVFKRAEAEAANIQDEIKKDSSFMELDFGDISKPSFDLREKYRKKALDRVIDYLKNVRETSYRDLYCKAMAMPLITEFEFIEYLNSTSQIGITLDGERRKKPSIDKKYKDRVSYKP